MAVRFMVSPTEKSGEEHIAFTGLIWGKLRYEAFS